MYFTGKHLRLALLELLIFKLRLLQLERKVLPSDGAEITNQQPSQQYHSSSVSHDLACHLTHISAWPKAWLDSHSQTVFSFIFGRKKGSGTMTKVLYVSYIGFKCDIVLWDFNKSWKLLLSPIIAHRRPGGSLNRKSLVIVPDLFSLPNIKEKNSLATRD